MQINVSYITANDIMEILGVGRSKAYEIELGRVIEKLRQLESVIDIERTVG